MSWPVRVKYVFFSFLSFHLFLLESLDERKFFLVEREVFGDDKDDFATVPFLQLEGDVVDEQFVAGNGQPVLGIEVCEVRELERISL